jgi:hypothetical protein
LCAAKGYATQICENIIANDQRYWKEKPNHALENIVHDEMSLHHYQEEGHMRPRKLSKLKTVVARLQRSDEENKALVEIISKQHLCIVSNLAYQ